MSEPVSTGIKLFQSKLPSISPPKLTGSSTVKDDGTIKSLSDHKGFDSQSCTLTVRKPRNMSHLRKYRSRSPSQDKSPPIRYKSRSRSRSLPKGYRSRSRSRDRMSRSRHSRSRSRSFRSRRSRSRSSDRQFKNRRSRSRSHGRQYRNRRSRSPSASSFSKPSGRRWPRSRSRSREHSSKRYRSRSPSIRSNQGSESIDRSVWEKFQVEIGALEMKRVEEERLHDKNPEKHPEYKSEWKKFYKIRAQELRDRGLDPKLHNFESEWAYFWKFRMTELIRIDYERKKKNIKRRLNLPDDAEMPQYLQINEAKGVIPERTALTSHNSSALSLKVRGKGLIPVLRVVTAVEEQLGSLGPRVNGLLSEAFVLQRTGGSNPDSLLSNPENYVLLETVKEKLVGQVQSKIVKKSLEAAVGEAIYSILELLENVSPPDPLLFEHQLSSSCEKSFLSQSSANSNQLYVPGLGGINKVSIAQQIAYDLINKGRTDVTEAELQKSVNEFLGTIEVVATQARETQTMLIKERSEVQNLGRIKTVADIDKEKNLVPETQIVSSSLILNPVAPETSKPAEPAQTTQNPIPTPGPSDAFNMLMSVVKSGIKKADSPEKPQSWSSDEFDEPCSDKITPKVRILGRDFMGDSEKRNEDETQNLKSKIDFKKSVVAAKSTPTSEGQVISTVFTKRETPKLHSQAKKSPSPEIFKIMKKKTSFLATAKDLGIKKVAVHNRSLSPFSSRAETSNPLLSSRDEVGEDLKVIGDWDSDPDIDLDSFGKAKAVAYDKVNVKKQSPNKYEKNISLLNKSKQVVQNTVVTPPKSVSSHINIDVAIDSLMGELKNKTSKIEVISGKPTKVQQNVGTLNVSPALRNNMQSNDGQCSNPQNPQMATNKIMTVQGFTGPYPYLQQTPYGALQQGYYSSAPVHGNNPGGSVPYHYGGSQVNTGSAFYGTSGNAYYSTNTQWQGYYSQPKTKMLSKPTRGSNYGKN